MKPKEIENFLTSLYEKYGYDFRSYSQASVSRRLNQILIKHSFQSLTDLEQALYVTNAVSIEEFLSQFTVMASEMFRDAQFFKNLVEKVFPILATYPTIRIWHAGCSTGEEVFSLAILLHEAGLLERTFLYASDINPVALERTRKGVYSNEVIKSAAKRYSDAGGKNDFSEYYFSEYGFVKFHRWLSKNLSVFDHNLATDDVFSEMHLILCRNVLIYFDRQLQEKIINLFDRTLYFKGFLALGQKESLRFLHANQFEEFCYPSRIYRKNSYSRYSIFTQ